MTEIWPSRILEKTPKNIVRKGDEMDVTILNLYCWNWPNKILWKKINPTKPKSYTPLYNWYKCQFYPGLLGAVAEIPDKVVVAKPPEAIAPANCPCGIGRLCQNNRVLPLHPRWSHRRATISNSDWAIGFWCGSCRQLVCGSGSSDPGLG